MNELFSAILKLGNLYYTENSCEKTLVQYGDNHGFIPEESILLLSVS